MRTEVLDHGYVEIIETWGSDERIIEAARMSTAKGFQGWGTKGEPGDEKLLRYLWKNKHHTPFEMAGMTVEVQAPLFVFREWHRHRTQSYNELSARYTSLPDLFYIPSIDRMMAARQSATNKQSSEGGFTESVAKMYQDAFAAHYTECRRLYEAMLGEGVAREVARLVIPVAQYSRMRASANLRNWLGFLSLRVASTAQWEIRQFAQVVAKEIAGAFPRTYELFADHGAH